MDKKVVDFAKFKIRKDIEETEKTPDAEYLKEKEVFLSYYKDKSNKIVARNIIEAQVYAVILLEEDENLSHVEFIPATSSIHNILYILKPVMKSEEKLIMPPTSLFESFIQNEDGLSKTLNILKDFNGDEYED